MNIEIIHVSSTECTKGYCPIPTHLSIHKLTAQTLITSSWLAIGDYLWQWHDGHIWVSLRISNLQHCQQAELQCGKKSFTRMFCNPVLGRYLHTIENLYPPPSSQSGVSYYKQNKELPCRKVIPHQNSVKSSESRITNHSSPLLQYPTQHFSSWY